MGNLLVYPGTHHVVHEILREVGAEDSKIWVDVRQGETVLPQEKLPSLEREGVADGNAYEIIAKAGDVVIMHPWLAHGIGINISKTQPRLAVYCRVHANNICEQREAMKAAGKDEFGPGCWTGMFSVPLSLAPLPPLFDRYLSVCVCLQEIRLRFSQD